MTYGVSRDICVGRFTPDGSWADSDRRWSALAPKVQHFEYVDEKCDAAMLVKDFHLRIGRRVFSALAGWDYDGGSIPRWAWAIIGHPFMICYLIQLTWHDMVYCLNLLPRDEADWIMLEILQAFGGNNWAKRNAVWTAVRAGGAFVYPKTASELCLYRDYIFMTDLGKTEGICTDERLTGRGPRISVRPEIFLDWETIPLTEGLETLLS